MNMKNDWKAILGEKLPLLGHRNWIVVTDMAYPLQSNPGVTTLYADEPFETVVGQVSEMIAAAPHVFAHTRLDEEQHAMTESLCKGWDNYRSQLAQAIDMNDVAYLPHEELIHRLDEVCRLFNAVIIKTPLTIPYSSVFFELDCAYWDAGREEQLRKG